MRTCCYARITRRDVRCFVTAYKHVNNIRPIARQLLGKRVPAATDTHMTIEVLLDYNSGNGFFCVVRAKCYKQVQLSFGVRCLSIAL
jgi:hypothetical protein